MVFLHVGTIIPVLPISLPRDRTLLWDQQNYTMFVYEEILYNINYQNVRDISPT